MILISHLHITYFFLFLCRFDFIWQFTLPDICKFYCSLSFRYFNSFWYEECFVRGSFLVCHSHEFYKLTKYQIIKLFCLTWILLGYFLNGWRLGFILGYCFQWIWQNIILFRLITIYNRYNIKDHTCYRGSVKYTKDKTITLFIDNITNLLK